MSDTPLRKLAEAQGVKPIESADELRTDDPMTDEEGERYRRARSAGFGFLVREERHGMTKYRVWVLMTESGRNIWEPVSIPFEKHEDADRWARYLNTDRYRIDPEED